MKNTLLIGAMLLFPFSAHAISDIDVPIMSCSGAETSNLTSFLSLSCAGNLSLSGGSLFSDSKIVLTATGSMTLDNLNMTAPNIDLSGNSLVFGSGVSIDASNSMTINAGGNGAFPWITTPPWGNISIGSGNSQFNAGAGFSAYSFPITSFTIYSPNISVGTVPEPDIVSMLPVGIITLTFLTRTRRRTRHP